MARFGREAVEAGFLVANWSTGKPRFALFNSDVSLRLYDKMPETSRHMVRGGNGRQGLQKPHFDIDLDTAEATRLTSRATSC